MKVDQLSILRQKIGLTGLLAQSLARLNLHERLQYRERIEDLFAQAVCWCKLDLQMRTGLTQENQRISADELMIELDQGISNRVDYVLSYILAELDLAPDCPMPSS
ncbi:MAG: hypothetical protein A4E19_10270 [Nitrospira sp. SG-bin1]|nr:MAG: hypothetical protein A4E19_10270 [Nitrospira sp. SG-bin1]